MPANYKEIAFENSIEHYLLNYGGYILGAPKNFNRELALDVSMLIDFIQKAQPKQWEKLCALHGAKAEQKLIQRINKEIEVNGLLAVLRKGIVDFGIYIKLAYFKPVSGMNEEAIRLYNTNNLSIIRQVKYTVKNENSLDIVLFLNGFPIVTLELKNQFTGQSVTNAMNQYKYDRSPGDLMFHFNRRTLIHFAVDTDEVYMTTRLKGANTKFLPFNKGNSNGAGNPSCNIGYKTSYLWEDVLCKDSLLDIVARFLHLQQSDVVSKNSVIKSEAMIFPRYHQLDVVRKLQAETKSRKETNNYLIQHSAGSGKSNSIAWLSHSLATLHFDDDEPVFSSVVVVTDRRILDSQLQNTIYQFEHKQGFIERIDKNSTQLAEALATGKKIIITTIQKFPFVLDKVGNLDGRRFAVIIDEAHSSQSGEAARKLKEVLTDKESLNEESEDTELDFEDEIIKELTSHGRQKNISFFAFTATPKSKTLEIFGMKDEQGIPRPFHTYSMRQAIEEGFILNVLDNYTTYNTYYKLSKGVEDDPEYDKEKAKKAINRFVSLHPENISQKVAIIIDHLRNKTIQKISGKAKTMLITSSRLQAVKYYLACKQFLEEQNVKDVGILVAFSGVVYDEDCQYTEEKFNGFAEGELPSKFASGKYNLLIVADKYQTGFDQPLLHTMFIDKQLSGVKAVQTLSRLNRTFKGKYDTFVLDFVNSTQDILSSFQPYFEQTEIEDVTDPNIVYDLRSKLDGFGIYTISEIESFARVFFRPIDKQYPEDHSSLYNAVNPAVDRFMNLPTKEQQEFKSTLQSFVRYYTFICQIVKLNDLGLHEMHAYSKFLLRKLPDLDDSRRIDLSGDVDLEYYRIEKSAEAETISLEEVNDIKLSPISLASKLKTENNKVPLSEIINEINDRFGTAFKDMNETVKGFVDDCVSDKRLTTQALNNSIENFKFPFNEAIVDIIIGRAGSRQDFISKYLDDENFQIELNKMLLPLVYEKLRD